MKKILLIISMLLLMSACGEIETSNSVSIPKQPDNDNGSVIEPGGDNGTIDPGGDNGTIDPGGDNGTIDPGGDNGTTDPGGDNGTIDPGGDNGTIDPGGDNGTIDPGGDGNDNGTTTEPVIDYNNQVFAQNLYYGRSLLTTNEQQVYDQIVKKLLAFEVTDENKNNSLICVPLLKDGVKLEYNFSTILKQLSKIAEYVAYDEQRITYLFSVAPKGADGRYPTYEYDYYDRKYYTKEICFTIKNLVGGLDDAKLGEKKASYELEMTQVETGVKEILSKLKDDMTEAQKFRVLHDELIKRVSYGMKDEGTGDIRGAFIYNKVLCEGYARTLAYLCQRAGLECIYVVGTASYDGTGGSSSGSAFNHAWIKVKIDGQWYNVDPTNNDGMTPGSSYVYYNNFLQSDAEFMKDHKEGITTTGQTTSYAVIPKSAATSYDKNATDYP